MYIMAKEQLKGNGRLVPTRLTGVEYKVKYGIELSEEAREHGGGWGAARGGRWTRCSVRAAHHHPIPDGSYFLHADDGRVHQLKAVNGEWSYLAVIKPVRRQGELIPQYAFVVGQGKRAPPPAPFLFYRQSVKRSELTRRQDSASGYSLRRAIMGSTCVARRAGMYDAASATRSRRVATANMVTGSPP